MSSARESAALVALLQLGRRPQHEYAEVVERASSAVAVLAEELAVSQGQASLLPEDPAPLLSRAEDQIAAWRRDGLRLITVLDDSYPENLRTVHDRPPILFVSGGLTPADARSVAIVGARRAGSGGLAAASILAGALARGGYVVVSGLAAGIDTAAHEAALSAGGRTVAVIGTGLRHSYPPENAALQRRIAAEGAVVSQFWPDAPPTRASFPLRNAVMSGLALGTVVVEASFRSGARLQARLALAHGRPVFLWRALLEEAWAREVAQRPGVHVIDGAAQVMQMLERVNATDALVE
ncbi:MAG TPA: DNA-processing protein DprA [Solirubrobacteraceae bacterium]|jgi:DNA processing protein|nr:DNA-processing protein DprA [Solirubrobacteraceae bacterium]